MTLEASVSGDGYPEFAREAFRVVFHGASPEVVRAGGRELRAQGEGFVLPNAGTDFVLEAEIG